MRRLKQDPTNCDFQIRLHIHFKLEKLYADLLKSTAALQNKFWIKLQINYVIKNVIGGILDQLTSQFT